MNNPVPAVSIIIPTYNRGLWIGETVDSVSAQSFKDFELLVVDDGSTDDTFSVVGQIPNVRYFRRNENSGVSSARNFGLREAQGRYIAFLDSDDLWQVNKLQSQVEWMESHPDCVICYTDEMWVRNGVRVNPMEKHQKCTGDIFKECISLCFVSSSSAMMRRSLFDEIGDFDESMPACEDYDFWLRVALRYPFHYIPEKLIVKRGGHPDQLSRKYWGMDRFRIQALEKILAATGLDESRRTLAREAIVAKSEILYKGFMKRNKLAEAEHYCRLIKKHLSCRD